MLWLCSGCCHYYINISHHLYVWPHLMVIGMEIAISLEKLASNFQQRTYVTTVMFPSVLKARIWAFWSCITYYNQTVRLVLF